MNIALIGPRGVGKSKTSRKLSKLTGMPVVSTDMIAVYESGGISISEIIKQHNNDWRPFRQLEFNILNNLKNSKNIILDCGGGILFDIDDHGREIYSERKVTLLKSIAKTVCILRNTDYLIEKVVDEKSQRPALSQINSYKEILTRRLPYYTKASDYLLNTDDMEPKDVAEKIISILKLY